MGGVGETMRKDCISRAILYICNAKNDLGVSYMRSQIRLLMRIELETLNSTFFENYYYYYMMRQEPQPAPLLVSWLARPRIG